MDSTFICDNCENIVPVVKNGQHRSRFCSRSCKISYYQEYKVKPIISEDKKGYKRIVIRNKGKYLHKCIKCGNEWKSDIEYPLSRCSKCKTLYWFSYN